MIPHSNGPAPDNLVLNIDSDEPGDNTIRPCRPELRSILEKERESLNGGRTREDTLEEQPTSDPEYFNVDSDGPGDNTIRPCRPELRSILEREREILRRYGTAEHSGESE